MICKPCKANECWVCESPPSCPCSHRRTVNGVPEPWHYKAVQVQWKFGGQYEWLWRLTNKDTGEVVWLNRGKEVLKATQRDPKDPRILFTWSVDGTRIRRTAVLQITPNNYATNYRYEQVGA